MNIRHPQIDFPPLTERTATDMIVIHHTGGSDVDASAIQINQWHINQNYSCIGYHFVIRKDGTVEVGRPEWAVGAHAYGENYHTLGIHLSGDFEQAAPTQAQIQACSELVADLCRDYQIPVDREHIVGHCDLMATACPGKNLYSLLPEIISRANKIHHATAVPVNGKPVENIFDLARRYESNGDPAAIGHGYGLYQFTEKTALTFVDWLKNYQDDKLANYGRHLESAKNFDGEWQMLGTVDPGHFSQLQDEFVYENYFLAAVNIFAKSNFNVDKHSLPLQAVVFARAIQHGVFGCLELFKRTCPYPNLSYVDDTAFDRQIIADVYDYLIDNPNFGRAPSKLDDALRNRFLNEKTDALA